MTSLPQGGEGDDGDCHHFLIMSRNFTAAANANANANAAVAAAAAHQGSSTRLCRGLLDPHLRFADLIRYVMGLL